MGPPATDTEPQQATAGEPVRRPTVRGKALYLGGQKLQIRGVTYGPFGSDPSGGFDPRTVERDFAQMAGCGINAVRVYSAPERWLLDLALLHGLHVMVGITWEQHIAFLDTGAADGIEQSVRDAIRPLAGHPAVLCYSIGNEIPASIVRWHGHKRIERFLARLCRAAREEDPGGLVTYVNFPPTEYLRLSGFDFLSFNVYLEHREELDRYLGRLQNLADERPLLMAEIGLDSRRNGEDEQARSLRWQLEACNDAGCAGAFVFAWTDAWHRGGYEILDWDFGLTTRARAPKPALAAVREAFATSPIERAAEPPAFTVAVCTYNGAATLRECLEGVQRLRYPSYEVVVVSDGSTDDSPQIARSFGGMRVIETAQRGLSAARNTAIEHARGEIIAFIDDDASPDPDWLTHLAAAFESDECVAAGGPNVPPAGSGRVAQCVANAPGGPTHVLISDREAEHIPGCNMAIRKRAVQEIGGFDPQFRAAGDDVDVCWRLLEAGGKIAFSPGAVVCHHRRRSVRGYLRQQRAYGKAEALLERKHPEKYSAAGHISWDGRLYGNGSAQHRGGWRWHVYYGGWGTAFFQPLYGPRNTLLESLPLMPEWYLAIASLAVLSAVGIVWSPALVALPLLALAVAALVADAALGASRASFESHTGVVRLRALTGALYLLQPLARLQGRLSHGLTPWRRRGLRWLALPLARTGTTWSETWQGTEERVRALAAAIRREGAVVASGGDWDSWDLYVRGGLLGGARARLGIEEHGAGRQFVRVRTWPRASSLALAVVLVLGGAAVLAGLEHAHAAAIVLAAFAILLLGRVIYECSVACATARAALGHAFAEEPLHDALREPEPPRVNLVHLAEQMRMARAERVGIDGVAKR
ncbi:MAG TPA: glycosyltransferase [Solirubrobacteraceae bacterium]|jgi:GT2 family glycosyltransferase|nr:glycosyltransferase [Solirubrobacteraceae bacterium]